MTPSLWLVTAHLLGDFPLQPEWISKEKTENNTRLLIHIGVHAFLNIPIAWVLYSGEPTRQLVLLVWIAGTHLVIDHRRWVDPKESWGERWVWLNDQIFHFVALSLALPIAELGLWA